MLLIHPPLPMRTELDSELDAPSGSTGHSCLPLAIFRVRSPLGCSNSRVPSLEVLGSLRRESQPPENIVALSTLAPLYQITCHRDSIPAPGAPFRRSHRGSMPPVHSDASGMMFTELLPQAGIPLRESQFQGCVSYPFIRTPSALSFYCQILGKDACTS